MCEGKGDWCVAVEAAMAVAAAASTANGLTAGMDLVVCGEATETARSGVCH